MIIFMILLQNWTEIMHSHLKSGTMLISMPWNQSLILIQIMQTLYGGKTLTPHLELSPYRKKTIRIINNQPRNSHSSLLFKKSNILKFEDKILINNIIFISKSINNLQPPIFKNWFIFCSDIHKYDTVSSSADKLFKPSYRTDSYGRNSVIIGAINCWNKMQNILRNQWLKSLYPNKIKTILTKRCIDKN